jgi:hypothetical protein
MDKTTTEQHINHLEAIQALSVAADSIHPSGFQNRVGQPMGTFRVRPMRPVDYDNYWDEDIKAHLTEFVLLSKAEYEELLKKTGFFIQETQRSIFDELNHR